MLVYFLIPRSDGSVPRNVLSAGPEVGRKEPKEASDAALVFKVLMLLLELRTYYSVLYIIIIITETSYSHRTRPRTVLPATRQSSSTETSISLHEDMMTSIWKPEVASGSYVPMNPGPTSSTVVIWPLMMIKTRMSLTGTTKITILNSAGQTSTNNANQKIRRGVISYLK